MTTAQPVRGGQGLRAKQVADAAGVNRETLRYYERRGLLAEPERTLGGHRLYPVEAVDTLRIIKAGQRLGFTLDEVAELLEVGRHRHGAGPDSVLQERARAKIVEIDQRMADLATIRGTLAAAVEAGCDDLATCAETDGCPIPFVELASRPDAPAEGRTRRRPAPHSARSARSSAV